MGCILQDIPILMVRCGEIKHPNDLLLTRIPVPPACIRPSVPSGKQCCHCVPGDEISALIQELKSGSTEDDLTLKLAEIILINDVLQKHKKDGASVKTVMETWEHLQVS